MNGLKIALALALVLVLEGCRTVQPLPAGEAFRFDISGRGLAGERSIVIDASADFGSPLGQEIVLDDRTSSNDAIDGIHRIHVGGLRPQTGRRAAPTSGHIEFREMAARSLEIVFDYKGHTDVYRLSMLPSGGVRVDPSTGEFSRVYTRP